MIVLLALLHLILPPVWMFGGYLMRVAEMRDEIPKGIAPPKPIDRTSRNGKTWLLLSNDGQMCEGRWVTPKRAARAYGGSPKDYDSAWISWEGDELSWTPDAYMAPLKLPTPIKGAASDV